MTTDSCILGPLEVNDVHSALNCTSVSKVLCPKDETDLLKMLEREFALGGAICGHRHAMGGQQFKEHCALLDMRGIQALERFDQQNGIATFGAGADWLVVQKELQNYFNAQGLGWTFRQKQTGADKLSLGGAVSANAHGRGLCMKPFVDDVESLRIISPEGNVLDINRDNDSELFGLVCGGYGLFGIIVSVSLRLSPRRKLVRRVEICDSNEVVAKLDQKLQAGFLYGDYQFRIDSQHPLFLRMGVLSTYCPVEDSMPIPIEQRELSSEDWYRLLKFAHFDKRRAFEEYSKYYLSTDGQLYWSDLHQMNFYPDGYHSRIDVECQSLVRGSEMITELYVPREVLDAFLRDAAFN